MNKLLYLDVETTGLDAKLNDIIQLSGIVVVDSVEKETFNFKIQPLSYLAISQEALDVHGYTLDDLYTFEEPKKIYADFISILDKYIDKYDKTDKFVVAGYNVVFDMDFLKQFFVKNNDNYFGSYFNYNSIDPLPILRFLECPLENYKLKTVCDYLNIEITAHDSLSDIKATKKLIEVLKSKFSLIKI